MFSEPNDDSPESDNEGAQPDEAVVRTNGVGEVTNDVDKKQMTQFVTTIKNAEQQVGEHIIQALQHEDTVAVITTVAMGPDGQQRVVSAALDPERMKMVQEVLQEAEEEREESEPCFGFHCLLNPKEKKA